MAETDGEEQCEALGSGDGAVAQPEAIFINMPGDVTPAADLQGSPASERTSDTATDGGNVCFICLDGAAPLLCGQVCACRTLCVHSECLARYISSTAPTNRHLNEKDQWCCPICTQPYRVDVKAESSRQTRAPMWLRCTLFVCVWLTLGILSTLLVVSTSSDNTIPFHLVNAALIGLIAGYGLLAMSVIWCLRRQTTESSMSAPPRLQVVVHPVEEAPVVVADADVDNRSAAHAPAVAVDVT